MNSETILDFPIPASPEISSPDERSVPAVTRRFKPAFRLSLGVDPPNSHRCRKTLQALLPEVGEGELPAKQSARSVGDHDGVPFRNILQPGGKVGGLADHRPFFVDSSVRKISNNHFAGRQADASGQRGSISRGELTPGVTDALANAVALALGHRRQEGEHHLRHAIGDDAAAEVDQMQVDALVLEFLEHREGVRGPFLTAACACTSRIRPRRYRST